MTEIGDVVIISCRVSLAATVVNRDPSNSCRNGTDEAIIARDIATVALSVVLICVTHEVASRLAGLLAGGTFTTAGE
jgi:hypothetical protein